MIQREDPGRDVRAASPAAVDRARARWRRWRGPAVVFALAVTARLAFLQTVDTSRLQSSLSSVINDSKAYDWMAKCIVERGTIGFRGEPSLRRPMGYPLFLSAVYRLWGPDYRLVRVLQCVLDALTAVILMLTLRQVGQTAAGTFSGLLYAVYPLYVFNATEMMTEWLVLLLTALVVSLLLRVVSTPRRHVSALAAGVLCGCLFLTRPNNILLIGPFALLLLVAVPAVRTWRRLLAPSLFSLGFLIIYGPFVARNVLVFDRIVLTGTDGCENVLRGAGLAVYGPTWDFHRFVSDNGLVRYWEFHDPANTGHPFPDEIESDRRAQAMAWAIIRAHPDRFARYAWEKSARLFLTLSPEQAAQDQSLARRITTWAYRGVAILGLLGMALAWRRGLWALVCTHLIVIGASIGVVTLSCPWLRYRFVAADLAFVSAGGFALVALWQSIAHGRGIREELLSLWRTIERKGARRRPSALPGGLLGRWASEARPHPNPGAQQG